MNSAEAHELIETAAAPLYLILLGSLFLLDYRLDWSIARTWPAILILWGLMRALAQLTKPAS